MTPKRVSRVAGSIWGTRGVVDSTCGRADGVGGRRSAADQTGANERERVSV
jgi:hypothetical protein